jgi:shikimate 5-dehydrogenase
MTPNVEKCFFPGKIPSNLVFDMVYNPLETALIRRARDLKAEVILGLEMFLEQAIRQFEIFTEEKAPRAVMEKAAVEALAARQAANHG